TGLLEIPIADIGIQVTAAFLAISTERIQIERPAGTRRQVLVGIAPWVDWHALEVTVRIPVARRRIAGRLAYQGFQSLLGIRVAVVVELVHVQGRRNRLVFTLERKSTR